MYNWTAYTKTSIHVLSTRTLHIYKNAKGKIKTQDRSFVRTSLDLTSYKCVLRQTWFQFDTWRRKRCEESLTKRIKSQHNTTQAREKFTKKTNKNPENIFKYVHVQSTFTMTLCLFLQQQFISFKIQIQSSRRRPRTTSVTASSSFASLPLLLAAVFIDVRGRWRHGVAAGGAVASIVSWNEEDVSVARVLQCELLHAVWLTVLVSQRPEHFVVQTLVAAV